MSAAAAAGAICHRLCSTGHAAAWVDGERWEFFATDNGAEIVGPSILETAGSLSALVALLGKAILILEE